MFDSIITLTLNPALDLWLRTDTLEPEGLNHVEEERMEAGGKGINVSRVLAELGMKSEAVALCGEDNLEQYRALLDGRFPFRPVRGPGKIRENLTMSARDGTLIKLDRPGTFLLEEEQKTGLEKTLRCLLEKAQSPLLLLCGSIPQSAKTSWVSAMLSRLGVGQPDGPALILDTLAFSRGELLALRPFMIKPNGHELSMLCGRKASSLSEIVAMARSLCEGGAGHVLVSLGEHGLVGTNGQEDFLVPGLKVPVSSTVAAGDSVVAGFVAACSQGLPFPESLLFAAACGTAAVMKPGSGVGTRKEILRLRERLVVSQL